MAVSRSWRIGYAMKGFIFFNVAIVTYLFTQTENIARKRDYSMIFKSSKQSLPWNTNDGHVSGGDRNPCEINLLIFGMKEHWKEFCRFPEMSRFKNLVQFPRTFNCQNLKCHAKISYSESSNEIPRADIVLFTNVYQWLTPDMWAWAHGNRSDAQPWVLVSVDSPLYVPGLAPPDQFRDSTYNLIASYKGDSDVHLPYGYYEPYGDDIPSPQDIDLKAFARNKTDLIAWMSSNCFKLQWDRGRLVEDIDKILRVDKYGKCGDKEEIPWNDQNALKSVLGRHKFYLSFENSCCGDYISGRFWRALDIGMLPIVVGASLEEYTKVAPPNSFIHVDQFDSLAALMIHLTWVSNDAEGYLQYFEWRKKGRIAFVSQEDQYVAPLKTQTHCSILEKYLQYNGTATEKRVAYMGKRWQGSCKKCGNKWIQNYMIPT